jgi:hypothetical protein
MAKSGNVEGYMKKIGVEALVAVREERKWMRET